MCHPPPLVDHGHRRIGYRRSGRRLTRDSSFAQFRPCLIWSGWAPQQDLTSKLRSRLRRPPTLSREFVRSTCLHPLAAARRGQDHSAYIPDHGRRCLLSLLLRLLPSCPRVVVPKHIVHTGCELTGLRPPSLDVSVCSSARAGSGCGSSRWLRCTRGAASHPSCLRPGVPQCRGARL